jgi:hypothetical protein
VIWVSSEANFFIRRHWTAQITLNHFSKLDFAREAKLPGFATACRLDSGMATKRCAPNAPAD